jgi:hypothetical protein
MVRVRSAVRFSVYLGRARALGRTIESADVPVNRSRDNEHEIATRFRMGGTDGMTICSNYIGDGFPNTAPWRGTFLRTVVVAPEGST